MKLYRPVGLFEMKKILDMEGMGFPPRLEEQPIFYLVLNYEYAKQIASEWNVKDYNSGFAGYVIEFTIKDDYIENFEIHRVGQEHHKEFWIPAEILPIFNDNIIGKIKIIDAFFGENYTGIQPERVFWFKEKDLNEQLMQLEKIANYNMLDFSGTVSVEWKLINLNYIYWKRNNNKSSLLDMLEKCLERNNKKYFDSCTALKR